VPFAIAIIEPPGYRSAAAFREVGETLLHGLRRLGHDAVLGGETDLPGRRTIVLGANLLPLSPRPLPRGTILYNLEQIAPGSPWLSPAYVDLLRQHEVWDYSPRNAARYGEVGLEPPRVVPIGFVPELVRIPADAPEEVDVTFYGTLNARRAEVLDALRARGLSVNVLEGVFGAARDAEIARSRLVLNLHYYEAKVFEVVRVSYLLANGRCVVSERGADLEEERYFEPGIAFAAHGELADVCARLARDPGARARLAAEGRALFTARDEVEILREAVGAAPPGGPSAPRPGSADAPVLAAVRPSGKRVLWVGCRDGEGGATLLAAGAAEVVGLDPLAGRAARERLTAVFRLSADSTPPLPYPPGHFDALVVDDPGRLEAPLAALAHLRRFLDDEGRLVARPATGAVADLLTRAGFSIEDGPEAEGGGADAAARVLTARPAVRLGATGAPIPDPWRGSRPTRLLVTPDAASPFWEALVVGAAHAFAGNRRVTLGVAVPPELVADPPPGLRGGLLGLDVDVLLLEAPADYDAWERLVAGATLWIGEASRPDLRAMAVRAGVELDEGP